MSDINDKKYVWAIDDIYGDVTEWEKDYKKVLSDLDFSEFSGKLSSADAFYNCMQKMEKVGRIIEKISVYAMMLHDTDTRNSDYDALVSKSTMLSVRFGENTAFITPELTALSNEVLSGFISDEKLKDYDYFLKGIVKDKAHVLSENEEKILAGLGETTACFKDIFTKIDNADLPLRKVKTEEGPVKLSHGIYSYLMQSSDRDLRKRTFKSYYSSYKSLINVISATYCGNVKKDVFYAKTRKYDSALTMALAGEDVDKKVYDNLIKSVREALPSMHRYIALKKKILGYEDFHLYDMYVPIIEGADLKLDYEKAYDLVLKGLAPLGEEYVSLLKKAKDERWIDVYESEGKRSGAYSVAVYDTHPYVLLNYQKTTHDVFTIAHELGHSIHSYFSNRSQPYFKADYKIFVAEIASTVNEVLLSRYLLSTAKEEKLKKYILSYMAEMIRTTLFRQTQFAEFEVFAHSEIEKGEALTKEKMNDKYLGLNAEYYGDALFLDDEIKYEWARIPHFYRAFYVYKYATGIISALAIADRILTEGESAVKDYFAFLSSGGSDSPVELLKIAGVDLNEEKPFKAAFKFFDEVIDGIEKY